MWKRTSVKKKKNKRVGFKLAWSNLANRFLLAPSNEPNRLIVSRRPESWHRSSTCVARENGRDVGSFVVSNLCLSSTRHFNRACKVRTRAPPLPHRHRRRQKNRVEKQMAGLLTHPQMG